MGTRGAARNNLDCEMIHKCSITGEDYKGFGNNAWPFNGRCSDLSNDRYVLRARFYLISLEILKETEPLNPFLSYVYNTLLDENIPNVLKLSAFRALERALKSANRKKTIQ